MKIYPSKHLLNIVDEVDLNEEVVIGYINTNYEKEDININIREDFNYDETKEILPYELFTSKNGLYPEITLYDKVGPLDKKHQNSLMIRRGDKYAYTPNASITYNPITFGYNVLAKKQIKYTSFRKFNIKVACNDMNLAKILIQYFADMDGGNLFPTNIKFNNGDVKIESLIDASLIKTDFIFIDSNDGEYYKNGEVIKYNEFLNYQTVPFIICDSIPNSEKIEVPEKLKFYTDENIAMNAGEIEIEKYFNIPKDETNIKYYTPFKNINAVSPIIIKEYINKGYVIYCHRDIIKSISKYYSIFYETLFKVYLNSYISTPTIYEWITDVMPDYIVQSGRLIQKDKFTSHMELHKLLSLYENDVYPIQVNILPPKNETTPIVIYTGISSNYLIFKKLQTPVYSDPIKGNNQISIYTEEKNIMYFDKFVYSIKENITNKISYITEDNYLIITVQPFKNTYLDTFNFNTPTVLKYLIEDIPTQKLSIGWNTNTKEIQIATKEIENQIILADINIVKSNKRTNIYDMRKRGGGLNEDTDVLDCLDISNILGKSYRKGGTLIATINLPLKYKDKESELNEIIYNALKNNMIAEDHLILKLNFK